MVTPEQCVKSVKVINKDNKKKSMKFGIKITTFYDKSSFLKIIGDAFRTD